MVRCSVLGCKSDSEKKIPGMSFHSYPEDNDIRKIWIIASGRIDWIPRKTSKICSRHFMPNVVIKKKKLTVLLPDAMPILEIQGTFSDSTNLHSEPTEIDEVQALGFRTHVKHIDDASWHHNVSPATDGSAETWTEKQQISQNISGVETTPGPVQVQSLPAPNASAEQTPRTSRPLVVEPCSTQLAPAAPPPPSPVRPRGSALPSVPIKVTSGPSLKCKVNISLGADFNPVITDIKSEADLMKQEDEDPQSDDTLSLADDDDHPTEDLIPLSNVQVPLSNASDPLSEVKVEEEEVGVDKVEVTRPVKVTRPMELTRVVEEQTVCLPFHLRQELSRAGNNCYNLICIQDNQINKLSVRCGKQRQKLHSYGQVIRRRDKSISNLRAEVEALRSFITERGWEASSCGGGKIDVRKIQIQSSNTVVGQKKPNRQLLIVKSDYKPPKSSVSAEHTSDTQTSTVGVTRTSDILPKSSIGVKGTSDILQRSSSSIPGTSDVVLKSTVGVKRKLDIRQKSSSDIPDTSNVRQKSSVSVKRILNNPSIAVQPISVVPQTSSVAFQRTSDVGQNSLVMQIDGMHNAVLQPKLVRLGDNSMEMG